MSDSFKTFIRNNIAVLDVVESSYAVKSTIGTITIAHVNVYKQDQLIDAYSSTVVLDSTIIENVTFTESVIKTSLSVLNGSEITVRNIENPSNSTSTFISCSTESTINIDGLSYTLSQASMMLLNNVTGAINKVDIMSVQGVPSMIQIDD